MPRPDRSAHRVVRRTLLWVPVSIGIALGAGADPTAPPPASAYRTVLAAAPDPAAPGDDLASLGWVWPAERFRLARPYVAPAHEYGPGHRGVDLDLVGASAVRAPAPGTVAFSGSVAGRGILTIDHGNGLVTTLEPVESSLAPGTAVQGGEDVATLATGGHATQGTLHFGVRQDGEYINPMLLLGGLPRAVLLPCCE